MAESKGIFSLSDLALGKVPPIPDINIAATLELIAKNPRDRVYTDQQIYLDGYTFTNCCFNNCTLVSDSGIFALRACVIMANCHFLFGPSALRIIKLFHLPYTPSGIAQDPIFNAKAESNGTLTVE